MAKSWCVIHRVTPKKGVNKKPILTILNTSIKTIAYLIHHLAVINGHNCKQNWQSWAIPGKIQRKRGGIEDILFWKSPWNFLDLSLYPMKFQRKQAFIPQNSANLCDIPWKFQGQKKDPWKLHDFFLYTLGNFTSFLIDLCSFHVLSSITLEIPCRQPPIWIFPGIAHFGEF